MRPRWQCGSQAILTPQRNVDGYRRRPYSKCARWAISIIWRLCVAGYDVGAWALEVALFTARWWRTTALHWASWATDGAPICGSRAYAISAACDRRRAVVRGAQPLSLRQQGRCEISPIRETWAAGDFARLGASAWGFAHLGGGGRRAIALIWGTCWAADFAAPCAVA